MMHFRGATAVAAPQGTVAYTYGTGWSAQHHDTAQQPNVKLHLSSHRQCGHGDGLAGRCTRPSATTDGNLLQVGRPNINSTYGYDAAGQLTSIAHDGTGGTIQSYSYTLGRMATALPLPCPAVPATTLDSLNRLTGVSYPNGDSAATPMMPMEANR
ncbi:MAG: hypothetical protein R2932_47820 [Caldilineaceae bacterium]